jgi:hypothetical protein
MAARNNYEKAHELLAFDFHSGSTGDWRAGKDLPNSFSFGGTFGGTTVAYSDATEVGVVVSVNEPGKSESGLVALIFKKVGGQWRIVYDKQGHSSSRIDAGNYSPAGFIPGTHRETTQTWLILGFGLVGIIAVVAFLDWRLSRPRRRLA